MTEGSLRSCLYRLRRCSCVHEPRARCPCHDGWPEDRVSYFMDESIQQFARQVIETEAAAVRSLSGAIDAEFERAVRMIRDCPASVLTCGVGKAGHIARKISATLSSTGTPSHFLSPT